MSKKQGKAPVLDPERDIQRIDPGRLIPHPDNREFKTKGAEWGEFVESIGFHGVLMPILARPMGHDWQVLAGHRRRAGAIAAGLKEVPVVVRQLTDRQAIEIVFIENLHREELDTVEEARGVRGLLNVGMSVEEISKRISRDVRWVKTRQMIFDLGDEVIAAVKLPKEDPRHLGVRVVEEILKVPEEMRAQAIQLVLHNDLEEGTLNPAQARDVLQNQLVKPKLAEIEWEAGREKIAKAWRARLGKQCLKGTKQDLLVVSVPWAETERVTKAGRGAEVKVPVAELAPEAPQGMMWLHLAVRHGMPVKIVHDPAGGQDRSFAVVDMRVLVEAEEANARDASFVPWLVTKERGKVSREPAEEAAAVAPAKKAKVNTDVRCEICGKKFYNAAGERKCGQCGKDHCESCSGGYSGDKLACVDCKMEEAEEDDDSPAADEPKKDWLNVLCSVCGTKWHEDDGDRPCTSCAFDVCADCSRLDAVGAVVCKTCDEAAAAGLTAEPLIVNVAPVRVLLERMKGMRPPRTFGMEDDLPKWAWGLNSDDIAMTCDWFLQLVVKPSGCAACDRGDFQLGHADWCPKAKGGEG